MLLNRETLPLEQAHLIRSYGTGYINVNGERFTHSLILSPRTFHRDWSPREMSDLSMETLSAALDLEPSILLVGTGAACRFLPPALTAHIMQQHIGVEVMDTPAACRTYNILALDGRSVVAALLVP